jgi:hypothetical protein
MMLQLSPPIPLLTPKGKGNAHVLIDVGTEHDLQWVCFIDITGECWTYRNQDVRIQENITLGRCGYRGVSDDVRRTEAQTDHP